MGERNCSECGARFEPTRSDSLCCVPCRPVRQRRLSIESGQRRAERARRSKTCSVCFGPIPKGRSKTCSPGCADERTSHLVIGWPPDACLLNVRSCATCGAAFIARRATTGTGRRRCDSCSVPEADRLRAKRAARADAIRAGEVVRLADVAVRDHHCCQLCRRKVDPRLRHPNPMSASLDHIVPLSKRGEHTMVNVQLAHLRCNMLKSDRSVGDQLRLLG